MCVHTRLIKTETTFLSSSSRGFGFAPTNLLPSPFSKLTAKHGINIVVNICIKII